MNDSEIMHKRIDNVEQELSKIVKTQQAESQKTSEYVRKTSEYIEIATTSAKTLNKTLKVFRQMKEMDRQQEQFAANILVSIFMMTLTILFSVLLIFAPEHVVTWVEGLTSGLTAISVLLVGLCAAYAVRAYCIRTSMHIAASWSMLFACYAGYVLKDFGSMYPHIAAIGFNVSTIAVVFSTYFAVKKLVKLSEYAPKDD